MRSYITKVFAGLFVVTSIAAMTWCWPFPLVSNEEGAIELDHIVAGPNGHLAVNWMKNKSELPFPNTIVSRIFTPGVGWSPQETLAGIDTFPADSGHFAVAGDGTVIGVWDEVPANESLGRFLTARKFVPGRGWGPPQNLGPIWAFPTPAISPDGRGHVVYRDGPNFVARTLPPGEETWSEPTVLRTDSGEDTSDGQVVAGNGFAYAVFRSITVDEQLQQSQEVYLARYDANGWARGERISDANHQSGAASLLINNGHVAVAWSETISDLDITSYIMRLTDTLEKFTAPKPFCAMSLGGDGALLLACETEGDAVPGCFQPSNNGPDPIYYRYIETYKRGMNDDHWTDPQIASDVHRRVRNTKAFADIEGSGFLVWGSDVPCGTGVAQLRARIMSSEQSSPERERLIDEFPPEEQPYGFNFDAITDSQGTLHVIWARTRLNGEVPFQYVSNVFTTELPVRWSKHGMEAKLGRLNPVHQRIHTLLQEVSNHGE